MMHSNVMFVVATLAVSCATVSGQTPQINVVRIGEGLGYTGSNVNSTSFVTDPLASHGAEQYVVYYDDNEGLVVGKRTIGADTWSLNETGLTAEISDAHRVAVLGLDNDGFAHVSWGHHAGQDPFNYIRSTSAGSILMTSRLSMPGIDMTLPKLTYPEFFYLPDGELLFTYRLGGSGNGDTYIQKYHTPSQTWSRLHNPTILGRTGDTVNAYPNGIVFDSLGRLHWTWCWRETPNGPDQNRDQLYARSPDLGVTWTRMDGTPYELPITLDTAEIVWPIPLNSYIANHSHMAVDHDDRPMIAQYYDPGTGRRIMLTWFDGAAWNNTPITDPIGWTRPLILVDGYNRILVLYVQAGTLKLAYTLDPQQTSWTHVDMVPDFFGNDPVMDRRRFVHGDGMINIFYQNRSDASVNVLEWDPSTFDPPIAPTSPVDLVGFPDDQQVRLTWTRPYGAASFDVKRALDPAGPFELIASVSDTTFSDTNIGNGANIYYVIAAVNDAGSSENSEHVAIRAGVPNTREPLADTYARSGAYADDNFGTETSLMAKLTPSSDYTRETFLRFDVSDLAAASHVRLRLVPTALGAEGDATALAFDVLDDDAWSESGLTWNNRPTQSSVPITVVTGYARGEPVEIDLTDVARTEANRDGLLSIRISSAQAGGAKIVHFGSRERTDAFERPTLIDLAAPDAPRLTITPTCPGGGPINATWTGASNGGRIALLYAPTSQARIVPDGSTCSGTQLGLALNGLRVVAVITSDATGSGTFDAIAPAFVCGDVMQILDLDTCIPSTVEVIE